MLIEIFLAVVSVLLLWMAMRKPAGLPPGKWGWPLIGWLPEQGKYIDDTLHDLQQQYGDIYVWRFGTKVQVYIHDYHLLKQVFSNPNCADRPMMEVFRVFQEIPLGVSGSNGAIWQTNRRFFLHHLRDLGMGKSHLMDAIQDQARMLVDALKEKDGKPGLITDVLNFVIMNVIWKMAANKHFDISSPKHKYLKKLVQDSSFIAKPLILTDMMPWIRKYLPNFLFRKIFNYDKFQEMIYKLLEFFQGLIDEHKENFNPDDPKDLIDAYLLDMKARQENPSPSGDAVGVRSETDLRIVLFDALIAGSDTIYITMRWIIIYMAAYPEIQRKLQEELDRVLPNDAMVTFEEKVKLPYTEAVINEVLRQSSLANISLPQSPIKDVQVAGYTLPKGCMIIAVPFSMHYDTRYWDKPEVFSPERWLNSEGKFVMKREGYMPFGAGKRNCVGEGLARMELLVFTTAIFQNFTVSPPEGKMIDLLPDYDNMILRTAREQEVVFHMRNK